MRERTEEEYLQLVLEKLQGKIDEIDQKMEGNEQDIESMHEYYWENYSEFDEYGYERYDNNKALENRITEQKNYGKERMRYEKMLYSPYFGRVDFCYEDEDESEIYYIGIANLAEGRATDPYVYDWRAPIASLFYDYDKGLAKFEAPAGTITGEITRKKQYKIKNGKLVYVLENEINIDDEILQQTLSEHADAKLKSIVTTIQREQNSIIRDVSHRILAVQGCAGSGKTSVALHRIAYLLYHNRAKLNAAQILILSPNSIFADYISRILPELGEENICEMTFDDYAYRELTAWGEAEDRYDDMEKLLHAGENQDYFLERDLMPRTAEADYKQTKDYVREMDGFILELESDIVNFRDFHYKKMEMKERDMVELFYEKLCEVPIFSRMQKIAEYVIDAEETLRGRNMDEEEKQIVCDKFNRMYETRDLAGIYNRFLKSTGRKRLDLSAGMIPYEDVYPMLYLKYATMEPPKRRAVKHLVIDEMQDYSYLQYLILQKMFDCPMTILGDKVQTMAEKHQDVLAFLPQIFGKNIHKVVLNKSYRSTSEITAFASSLIGDEDIEKMERHGEAPDTIQVETEAQMYNRITKQIQELEEMDTVAVLTLDAASALRATEELRTRLGEEKVSLLTKDSMKFSAGVSVMPFYLAKGLEFDAVFVPDLQNYETPLHRQALYIDATRALHVLRMYEVMKK